MSSTVFLLTPPFTQLNTPYPATCYLKGFLNTKGIHSFQADLGIEVILKLFCKEGFEKLFSLPSKNDKAFIFKNKQRYIDTINEVVLFLQNKNDALAEKIYHQDFLPRGERFIQLKAKKYALENLSTIDKAKHLATLYLEDISDYIKEHIDEHFGFTRYAECLGRSANRFDELYTELQKPLTYIDTILIDILKDKLETKQPELVCISVPFPGNLYSAFRCGQYIKKHYPTIKVAMGGGFPNTELRSVADERVFEFIDYITLDDGEMPLEFLMEHIHGKRALNDLKRTFTLANNVVTYINNSACKDYKQNELGTPDYSDLLLDQYISAIEVVNPMHKLWSDGRWNKLTMAHGCYWGKCTFCDVSLPYIKDYEPIAAQLVCDRMETIIEQTNTTGFHFVDEAAPPSLMRNLAIEILKRNLKVTWWTNIRFEKNFTQDLCYLLAASGCIAVSGGLEVASDRLLALINKGITVKQVAQVTKHFTKAGIMVHAYLMYGFPTQTKQETVDSMEMVRQLFEAGVVQSGFWHRFAMTSHSPVGINPEKFKVIPKKAAIIQFADNDVDFEDETGEDHDLFAYGLEKSLLNYMHLSYFDKPLQFWFDHTIPKTTIEKDYIIRCIEDVEYQPIKKTAKVIWTGIIVNSEVYTQSKKGMQREMMKITLRSKNEDKKIDIPLAQATWFVALLEKINIHQNNLMTYEAVKSDYEQHGLEDFELFWENKPMNKLKEFGLWFV